MTVIYTVEITECVNDEEKVEAIRGTDPNDYGYVCKNLSKIMKNRLGCDDANITKMQVFDD